MSDDLPWCTCAACGVRHELLAKWRSFRTAYMERIGRKLDRVTALR